MHHFGKGDKVRVNADYSQWHGCVGSITGKRCGLHLVRFDDGYSYYKDDQLLPAWSEVDWCGDNQPAFNADEFEAQMLALLARQERAERTS